MNTTTIGYNRLIQLSKDRDQFQYNVLKNPVQSVHGRNILLLIISQTYVCHTTLPQISITTMCVPSAYYNYLVQCALICSK